MFINWKHVVMIFTLIGFLSGVAWAGGAQLTEDDGSMVQITSPKDGAVVGDTVRVVYEFKRGSQADHVHTYVDGKYQKGFKGFLKGLSEGTHKITLKVANQDHDLLPATHSVNITVK